MVEPVYQFIKGEGWVLTITEIFVVKLGCGTCVRAERRFPNKGERFTYNTGDSRRWSTDEWLKHFDYMTYTYKPVYPDPNHNINERCDIWTLVPV